MRRLPPTPLLIVAMLTIVVAIAEIRVPAAALPDLFRALGSWVNITLRF